MVTLRNNSCVDAHGGGRFLYRFRIGNTIRLGSGNDVKAVSGGVIDLFLYINGTL